MAATVLLIDGSPDRRRLLRLAMERRGFSVSGEAGSMREVVDAVGGLEAAPDTILVGASLDGDSTQLARLLKRAWPKAQVLEEVPEISQAQHDFPMTLAGA